MKYIWDVLRNYRVEVISSALIMTVLYLYFYAIGISGIFVWNPGIRDWLCGFASLSIVQILSGYRWNHPYWITAYPVSILWVLVFPFTLSAASDGWIYFERINPYVLSALGGSILLFYTVRGISHLNCIWSSFILGLFFAFCSLPPLVYLGHYLVYHKLFTGEVLLPILQTNLKEATQFLQQMFTTGELATIFLSCLSLFIAYGALIIWAAGPKKKSACSQKRILWILQGLLIIAAILLVNRWITRCFPLWDYRLVQEYQKTVAESAGAYERNAKNLTLTGGTVHFRPRTVILVIGESANRDHMKAFNKTYPVETTPWLSQHPDGFFLYPNAYSNYPNTIKALSMYLTSMNQYNGQSMQDAVTLVDVAKKAGYTVYWLSNQSKMGAYDNANSIVANRADYARWTNIETGDDAQLLTLLKAIPASRQNLIIIHLMGSHALYKARVPETLQLPPATGLSETEQDYDRTILYTDEILQKIFNYGKENLNLDAMMYCSDHGEDMKYGHSAASFTFPMVRIPLWIYLSETYRNQYPDMASTLASHESSVFTNDLMFDTISGLLQAPNNYYNAKYDLSSSAYNLTWDAARTLHGKVRIPKGANSL